MRKLIVFDLDGTLADSKAPLDAEMATLLGALLRVVMEKKRIVDSLPCGAPEEARGGSHPDVDCRVANDRIAPTTNR